MASVIVNRPRLVALTVGQLECVKWLAFAAMIYDHCVASFFDRHTTAFGRIALPLFVFALAEGVSRSRNLCRPIVRLLLVAVISQPFYMAALNVSHGNVLFTFAIGLLIVWSWDRWSLGSLPVIAVLCVLAYWCEGSWFAVLVVVSSVHFARYQTLDNCVLVVVSVASLMMVNVASWALLSLPIYYALSQLPVSVPRIPRLFYVAYPVHLALINLSLLPRYC